MMGLDSVNQAVIKVTGKDAQKFLQGQLTCDVRLANANYPLLGAISNHKGRIISNFRLWQNVDDFFMVLPTAMVALTLPVLKKYGQFSKVDINESKLEQLSDYFINMINKICLVDDIRAGIVTILPETSGNFTAHDLALPHIGAVSFDKGCYTGQEIIARMHYRGKLKQHLYHIQLSQETTDFPIAIINTVRINAFFLEALVVAADELMNTDLTAHHIKILKSYI